MPNVLLLASLVFSTVFSISFSASAWAQPTKTGFPTPLTELYVPLGFDTNDPSIEVVVEGFLPDMCHRRPHAVVRAGNIETKTNNGVVFKKGFEITVTNHYFAGVCAEVIVPFTLTVKLPPVKEAGPYVVVAKNERYKLEAELKVDEPNSPATSNHQYASVDYVEVGPDSDSVFLVGYNPSKCLQLDRIKSISNGRDTISVLPILRPKDGPCEFKPSYFRYEYHIPRIEGRRKVLLHVRRIDHQAINQVVAYPENR